MDFRSEAKVENLFIFIVFDLDDMRPLVPLILLVGSLRVTAQCLTDLKKVLPDQNTPKTASRVVMGGNYLVTNSLSDDTLNIQWAGAAYVYRQTPGGWDFTALLKPSLPERFMKFGTHIDIDSLGNTIAISNELAFISHATIHVFNKPAAGWSTMAESEEIILAHASPVMAISLSPDGLTLAIGQSYLNDLHGLVTIYRRTDLSAAFSATTPFIINGPAESLFYGTSLDMDDKHLIVGSEKLVTHDPGKIYIYLLDGLDHIATLRTSLHQPGGFAFHVQIRNDLIVTSAHMSGPLPSRYSLLLYKKPTAGGWLDAHETAVVDVHNSDLYFLNSIKNRGFSIIDANHIAVSFHFSYSIPEKGIDTYGITEVLHTNNPGDWSAYSRTVLMQEQLPPGGLGNFHGLDISNNHERIVVTPTNNANGVPFVNTITSFKVEGNSWILDEGFVLPGPNSAQHQYGYDIVRTRDALFVASPFDSESAKTSGAVYIYSKNQTEDWSRLTKVIPPFVTMGDANFGVSIAASDSMLAVGSSVYSSDKSKVYVYQRTGPSWNANTLIQQINTPPDLQHFGENVCINEKLLVIGFMDRLNPLNELMGIDIYERGNAGYVFSGRLKFFRGYSRLEPLSLKIKLVSDSIFLYEGISYGEGLPSTVKIYTKNSDEDWHETSSFELPAEISDTNLSFDVRGNHVFVGSPLTTVQGKEFGGAVVVYAKLPGEKWPSGTVTHSAVIYSSDVKAHSFFGRDVSNTENSLVIGAPGNYDFYDHRSGGIYHNQQGPVREVPGEVYIFETSDYFWKNARQILKLQGSFYDQQKWDGAGLSVDSDYDHYFFGAPNETNEKGFWAGAVYTISTPPLVKLMPPVCVYDEPLKLQGYPFGGVWSGVGVNGEIFDPSEAGPGKHLLTYSTPNCAYQGKLEIEVIENPDTALLSPLEVILCRENPVAILKVRYNAEATYQWYHHPNGAASFTLLPGADSASLSVDTTGAYYCNVTYGLCSANSSVVNVKYDTVEISTGPQPVICVETQAIQLTTSVAGGVWSGSGLLPSASGIFDARELPAGLYPVVYTYRSPAGCQHVVYDTVTVGIIRMEISPHDAVVKACEGEAVTLALLNEQPEANYAWLRKVGESFREATHTSVLEVVTAGSFKLRATTRYCEAETLIQEVEFLKEDSLWLPNVFTPNGDGYNDDFSVFTNNDDYVLQIFNRYGQELYKDFNNRPWDGGNHPTGLYFWIVNYSSCTGVLKKRKGWVHKMD